MGIDPFLVSSSVICVAAQRLVRQLCPHCRRPADVPQRELVTIGYVPTELDDLQIYTAHAKGCARCKNGYRGRIALLETFPLDATLKRMIVEGRSVHELKAEGSAQGMLTLRRVGLLNAMRGKTSLEEVLRVTMADQVED
jgi:type IV pilus assembly protein PilB